jgi:hypothetical protein
MLHDARERQRGDAGSEAPDEAATLDTRSHQSCLASDCLTPNVGFFTTATRVSTMLACAADKPRAAPLPVDCSVNSLYDFKPIYPFEVGQTGWYQSGDCTGGHWDPHPLVPGADGGTTLSDAGACVFDPSVASPNKGNVPLERIAEGDRCGSQWAAYIQSYGHRDWGSLFGTWDLGANIPPANGDGYEGVSFWARNPSGTGHARGPTNKTIWFMVGDWRQVVAGNSTTPYPPVDDYRCVPAPNDASVDSYNSNNQVSSGSRSPAPNECGRASRPCSS